jgi:hypothetical protein
LFCTTLATERPKPSTSAAGEDYGIEVLSHGSWDDHRLAKPSGGKRGR